MKGVNNAKSTAMVPYGQVVVCYIYISVQFTLLVSVPFAL